MKVTTQLALALLVLATGCASKHEKIVFADESQIRTQAASPTATVQKHLEAADLSQIEPLVFSYLLERHLWDLADYSAVFLQADDAQVAALMKKYPAHLPPIKPGKRAVLKSHRPPLDKDTKKPAIILTVEVNELNADDTVDATGRWYAGDAATGFRAFHLKNADGAWQILEVK
ncbi:MAG: hypothetical protein ABSH48_05130 [Verrucomicrobiota bacterium]|jgi:hypothetical protein